MFATVIIENSAVKSVANGHPWVSRKNIIGRKPVLPCIVNVIDKRRNFVGMAFCSPESPQFLRFFSRKKEVIDKDYWRTKIKKAYERRKPLDKLTNAYRVVYAESDGLPSIIIDKYNDIWVLQITSSGAGTIKTELIEIIKSVGDTSCREVSHPGGSVPHASKETIIHEGDQNFVIDVAKGQKTGAYLDYRAIRLKAKEFAKGKCLDAFCYEGHFSCQIAHRAESVVAVDSSARAIQMAKRNAELNGHKNIQFVKAGVFEFLSAQWDGTLPAGKCPPRVGGSVPHTFDFIHLDPPSFVKSHDKIASALAGYKKLINASLKLLNPNGIILISSCSHNITERLLESCIPANSKILWRGTQDKDHPISKGFPESLYLKAIAFSPDPASKTLPSDPPMIAI